jgi:hypothetical protein
MKAIEKDLWSGIKQRIKMEIEEEEKLKDINGFMWRKQDECKLWRHIQE